MSTIKHAGQCALRVDTCHARCWAKAVQPLSGFAEGLTRCIPYTLAQWRFNNCFVTCCTGAACTSPPQQQPNGLPWSRCGTSVDSSCIIGCSPGATGIGYQATCSATNDGKATWLYSGSCVSPGEGMLFICNSCTGQPQQGQTRLMPEREVPTELCIMSCAPGHQLPAAAALRPSANCCILAAYLFV